MRTSTVEIHIDKASDLGMREFPILCDLYTLQY